MFHITRHSRLYSRACAGALCGLVMFALAACGGGSSSVPAVAPTAAPTNAPTPKPTATPTPAPVTQSATLPVSSAPQTAALPVIGGYTPIALFPSSSAAAGATIAAVSTTQAPTGLTALQNLSRQIASTRTASAAASTVYLYEALTANSTIAFSSMPFFTLGLPSSVVTAGNTFYMAMLAPGSAQWQLNAAGPAVVNGQTLTFAPPANSSLTLIEGQTLWLAFYSLPAGSTPQPAPSTTPTVAPSATPTDAPTAAPTGNPSSGDGLTLSTGSITLNASGATATFVATENNYSGGFTASSADTGVATVASGIKGSFTVTAVAAGTTTITVSDNRGGSASIAVTVTTTGVTIH